MRQIRSNLAAGVDAANCVAERAGAREKNLFARLRLRSGGLGGNAALLFQPFLVISGILSDNHHAHVGVSRPAEFRVLSAIHARVCGPDANEIRLAGNHVFFAVSMRRHLARI